MRARTGVFRRTLALDLNSSLLWLLLVTRSVGAARANDLACLRPLIVSTQHESKPEYGKYRLYSQKKKSET